VVYKGEKPSKFAVVERHAWRRLVTGEKAGAGPKKTEGGGGGHEPEDGRGLVTLRVEK